MGPLFGASDWTLWLMPIWITPRLIWLIKVIKSICKYLCQAFSAAPPHYVIIVIDIDSNGTPLQRCTQIRTLSRLKKKCSRNSNSAITANTYSIDQNQSINPLFVLYAQGEQRREERGRQITLSPPITTLPTTTAFRLDSLNPPRPSSPIQKVSVHPYQ